MPRGVDRDGRHEHHDRGAGHDLAARRSDQHERREREVRPPPSGQLQHELTEQRRGSGRIERRAQRQHASDQDEGREVDRPVCLIGGQAARQDHEHGPDDDPHRDRNPPGHHGEERQHGHGDRTRGEAHLRPVGFGRLQQDQVRLARELPLSATGTVEQQGVAEPKRLLTQVRLHDAALPDDRDHVQPKAPLEVDLPQRSAGEIAPRCEHGFGEAHVVAFQQLGIHGSREIELEALERAQHDHVVRTRLDQQLVAGLEDGVRFRERDHPPRTLAPVPSDRENHEPHRVAEPRILEGPPDQGRIGRHAKRPETLGQSEVANGVGRGKGLESLEVPSLGEPGQFRAWALEQQLVARSHRGAEKARAALEVVTAPERERENPLTGMEIELGRTPSHERRIRRHADPGEPDLVGLKPVEGRAVRNGHQVTAATELKEMVGTALNEDLVPAPQHRVRARSATGPSRPLDREHMHPQRGVDEALGEGSSVQLRPGRHAQVEESCLQIDLFADPRPVDVALCSGRRAAREEARPDQGDEQGPGPQEHEADRREGEEAERLESGLAERRGSEQIGGGPDEGREAAELSSERHRDQKLRRSDPAALGDAQGHREHHRRDADVVHDTRKQARHEGHADDDAPLARTRPAQDHLPDQARHAGAREPGRHHEHAGDRDHRRAGEARQRALGRNQPQQRYGEERQERDDIHAEALRGEQYDRAREHAQYQDDVGRHGTIPAKFGTSSGDGRPNAMPVEIPLVSLWRDGLRDPMVRDR